MQIDEIRLLEHCYRFEEFVPMYDSVCTYSEYVNAWFRRCAGAKKLQVFLAFLEKKSVKSLFAIIKIKGL